MDTLIVAECRQKIAKAEQEVRCTPPLSVARDEAIQSLKLEWMEGLDVQRRIGLRATPSIDKDHIYLQRKALRDEEHTRQRKELRVELKREEETMRGEFEKRMGRMRRRAEREKNKERNQHSQDIELENEKLKEDIKEAKSKHEKFVEKEKQILEEGLKTISATTPLSAKLRQKIKSPLARAFVWVSIAAMLGGILLWLAYDPKVCGAQPSCKVKILLDGKEIETETNNCSPRKCQIPLLALAGLCFTVVIPKYACNLLAKLIRRLGGKCFDI